MSESKTCQNCKGDFILETEDTEFYTRMQVPHPTFCPDCRLQRRLAFRNERFLYKNKSAKSGKDILSIYSPDKNMTIYELKEWNAGDWDPGKYGKPYSFEENFFTQFEKLLREVPQPALVNWDAHNSEYCNFTYGNKNCYLVFGGDFNEDCSYSSFSFYTKNSQDLYWINKSELCYQIIDGDELYNASFCQFTKSSNDVDFCFDVIGCQDCFGCVNLRNQNHYFFNKKYSPEEYKKLRKEVDLGSYKTLQEVKEKFNEERLNSIFRATRMVNSVNSTGDNIHNSKNCKRCFDVFDGSENCRDIFLVSAGVKDSHSCDHIGLNSELCYDSISIYPGNKVLFSWIVVNSHDIEYSINCQDCSHLFGCVGLRNKEYCILNKQYTKEEYEELVPRIKKHMSDMPYTDQKGRIYKYGEFFPPELSPFAYNETIAQEYFPLTKEEALNQGYAWKDQDTKDYQPTIQAQDLPDHIEDTDDSITKEIIACAHQGACNHQCTTAFKIIPAEFQFYKRKKLPLPRLCPNCRHYERLAQRNPLRLWKRQCMCKGTTSENNAYANTAEHSHGDKPCPHEFETSYDPKRPETIYCEECYKKEVA